MPTFPISFPTGIGIKQSSFRLRRTVAVVPSPFSAQQQTHRFTGEWWEGDITFRPMTYAQSAAIKAWLASLQGRFGTFLYGDPDNLARGNQGAGGTILVNGAGQTGNILNVDGMTPSTTRLVVGDYFSLGTGTAQRLYMATTDLVANGSGAGSFEFEPRLRTSPADNTQLGLTNRFCAVRLADNSAEWSSNQSSVTDISISFVEAL